MQPLSGQDYVIVSRRFISRPNSASQQENDMTVDVVPTVIYSSMMGVVALAIIQACNKPKHKQTYYLLGLLVLMLTHIIGELYIYSGAYQYAPAIAGFQLPLRMLLGPALYFYAYMAMSSDSTLSVKSYSMALLGPMVVIVAMIPFMFMISGEQKLALANPATRDPELWKIAQFTCLFTAITFIAFTFAYLTATLRLHAQHRRQLMDKFSAIEHRSMDWLRVVLILWGLVWFIYTVNYAATFLGVNWFVLDAFLPVFELSVLLSFTYLALNQSTLSSTEKDNSKETQKRRALLPKDTMRQIAAQLTVAMSEKTLFKDEDLSLNRLATEISVSENYISETLSQELNTNFFQFVNSFRINEAKKLLTDTNLPVTTIVYEVGYKSKSTFNAAFKKIEGVTPSAYRASHLLEIQPES
ncbi:hypothetical protein GCM10011357_04430 [Lacimicrobium alkaliphilum]|uniref:HTH araC/xylS-type domain-containing protein n=1 Tax=Lacimicrobium alkaliphilum TaxID=1526571 RepID=A0ABQ1R010_9ALTE|nr:hypothetical protein GCM10011357_04430 [Lacimicrobium alkaliphilum]